MAIATKSRVSKSASKKSSLGFHWWYAAVAVLVIAIVGIAVIRLSNADTFAVYDFKVNTVGINTNSDFDYGITLYNQGNGQGESLRHIIGENYSIVAGDGTSAKSCGRVVLVGMNQQFKPVTVKLQAGKYYKYEVNNEGCSQG